MSYLQIVDEIYLIIKDIEISKNFILDILKRLESFTYKVIKKDIYLISFLIKKVKNDIKNTCNIKNIPNGMYYVAIDIICGEFLFTKKQSGNLDNFNLEAMAKQIQIGDTNVTFALEGISSKEEKLDLLIKYLIDSGKESFKCYRKISW